MSIYGLLVLYLCIILSWGIGILVGINLGIALAANLGPKAACEQYRFSFYICESLGESK